jgi:hypothetical protein
MTGTLNIRYVHLLQYLAELFLEWEVSQIEVVGKIKTHILCSIAPCRKSCCFWDNVEKYGRAGQATEDTVTQRMRFSCWLTKATNTHSEYEIFNAFPWQQWLIESNASILCYTCIACLVEVLVTSVRDGILVYSLLTHWGRVTQICVFCVFALQLWNTNDANLRF